MAAFWTRLNSLLLVLVLLALLALIGVVASAVRGGPLDPPGTPDPTDSVKLPGTPIVGPTTITEPGHYYLTRDVHAALSQTAITIGTSDVTLDLGGFTIASASGAGARGIQLGINGNQVSNIEIRNGRITQFDYGIDATPGARVHIHDVHVDRSFSRGIVLGGRSQLTNCSVTSTFGEGIEVTHFGTVVRGCYVVDNGLNGIFIVADFNLVESNFLFANGHRDVPDPGSGIRVFGDANTVRGNHLIEHSGTAAIYVTGADTLITDNTSSCEPAALGIKNLGAGTQMSAPDHANACLPLIP